MRFRPSQPANCWSIANRSGRGSSPFARPFGHNGSVSLSGSRRSLRAPPASRSLPLGRALRLPFAPPPTASVPAPASPSPPRRQHCGPPQPLLPPSFRDDRRCCSRGQELSSFDFALHHGNPLHLPNPSAGRPCTCNVATPLGFSFARG